MIKMIDGGIIWPRVPLAATVPDAKPLSYPALSIRGKAITLIITTEADTIPVEAASIAPTRTTLIAKPPLTSRNNALIETSNFSAIFDFSRTKPIAIKSGTAIRVVLLIIPNILNGSTSNTSNPSSGIKKAKTIDTVPNTKATGIPTKRSMRTTTNINKAIIMTSKW